MLLTKQFCLDVVLSQLCFSYLFGQDTDNIKAREVLLTFSLIVLKSFLHRENTNKGEGRGSTVC